MIVKKNIVILDDHPIVVKALGDMVENISIDFNVKSFSDTRKAYEYIESNNIDLIVLDIQLDEWDGFSFYRRIKSSGYKGKLIFFTSLDNPSYARTALEIGADGYCTKSMSLDNLKVTIIRVLSNDRSAIESSLEHQKMVKLSQRETLVLSYLIEGQTNKQIADRLYLSQKTISTYKSRLLKKHGVGSILELIKMRDNFGYITKGETVD